MPTITLQVTQGADDSYYRQDGGGTPTLSNNANDAPVGLFSAAETAIGAQMRFLYVPIPKNSTIVSANLIMTATANDSADTVNSKIRGKAADNATMDTTTAGFINPPFTTAVVNWDAISAFTANAESNSPDITTIIQELVNRAGWVAGNSMVIQWDDIDKRTTPQVGAILRRGQAFDLSSSLAPKLQITYIPPTTPVRGSLYFNGTSAYVNLGGASAKSISPWTVTAWVKPTLPQTSGMVYMAGDDNNGWGIGVGDTSDGSGSKLIGLFAGLVWLDSTLVMTNGIWQFIALTFDGTNAVFYLNSQTTSSIPAFAPRAPSAGFSSIGCEFSTSDTPQRYYKGYADEIKVYNTNLTAAQIAGDYAGGVGKYGLSTDSNIVGIYHLDEGTDSGIVDSASVGHPGVLTGSPAPLRELGYVKYAFPMNKNQLRPRIFSPGIAK